MKKEVQKIRCIAEAHGNNWGLYHGDSCELIKGLPDNSISLQVFSPPFSDLFTYSASDRDIGNCSSDDEFFKNYKFLVKEQFRVHMPGRVLAFHIMNLPTTKTKDGFIGIKNLRDDLIRLYQDAGFIYSGEVLIWKDPLLAASRTHAIGLAHSQIVKDSAMVRMGLPDYLVIMRKPGINPEPIAHPDGLDRYIGDPMNEPSKDVYHPNPRLNKYSHYIWQKYASPTWDDLAQKVEDILPTLNPKQAELFFELLHYQQAAVEPVWNDIRQSYTLNGDRGKKQARDPRDIKHVCPLQIDVIRRAIELYSNPGDVVLDPFNGIGSTGYVALEMQRKYIGFELKDTYFEQSIKNLKEAAQDEVAQLDLLSLAG